MREHQYEALERYPGLSYCPICGGAEGSLPSECPGQRMLPGEEARIYAGRLDFKHGSWRLLPLKGLLIRITSGYLPGLSGGVDPWVERFNRERKAA